MKQTVLTYLKGALLMCRLFPELFEFKKKRKKKDIMHA